MYQCAAMMGRNVWVNRCILTSQINVVSKENIGLYWNDGLGIFKNVSGSKEGRKKNDSIRIFKINGLSISVKTNLKVADFLDARFDLI